MPHRTRYIDDVKLFNDPLGIYHEMLKDIERAKNYIYLETFRFENDPVGQKFRSALVKKAKEGLTIKLLLDDWGTSVGEKFFKELIFFGGEIKYFKKVRLVMNFFSANHERDHRKLLIIDDTITYLGSMNITNYNLNWRENALRLVGPITHQFRDVFLENYFLRNIYKFDKKKYTRDIICGKHIIVKDVPSVRITTIRKKLLNYIKSAKEFIYIETPYFLPTFLLRDAMMKAAARGVDIHIATPFRSDVTVVNIYRQRFLGKLFEAGVKIHYYRPSNLHAKLMICDDKFYSGSSNFDYRSFRYLFEIGLFGKNAKILKELHRHREETLKDCTPFDYYEWANRRKIYKLLEWLIIPIRHFL